MSNTGQTAAETFGGRELETMEGVVDIAGVQAHIRGRDGVGLAPQRLAVTHPGLLVPGQVRAIQSAGAHGQS